MNIVFMGTPDFAVPTLHALIGSPDHNVTAVYSQPPRPAGRGQKLRPSPIHALADEHGIAVHTPSTLKDETIQAQFRCHGADVAVVAAYGLILPQPILDAYPHGCINVHPSDLPRWRGAAPIQRTIMAGDKTTSMCIMQMDEGLDTGDVLLREPFDIPEDITAGELHDIMAMRGATAVLEVLANINDVTAQPQTIEGITYANKIDKAEAEIDWRKNANEILNHIRGLNPYPAATAVIADEKMKVFAAEIVDNFPPPPGEDQGGGAHLYPPKALIENARKLRKDTTDVEKILWSCLRDKQLHGHKFRRQHPIPPYVVDFANVKHKLVIELDGGQHNQPPQQTKDDQRTVHLQSQGWKVIRFWNNEILDNIDGVLETISAGVSPRPHPNPLPGGEGMKGNPFFFVCGDGQIISITEAQRAGKKRMSADEILRGMQS